MLGSRGLLAVWSKLLSLWRLRPGELVTRKGRMGSNPIPGAINDIDEKSISLVSYYLIFAGARLRVKRLYKAPSRMKEIVDPGAVFSEIRKMMESDDWEVRGSQRYHWLRSVKRSRMK